MAEVSDSIRQTRHFQQPMEAAYFMPNAAKSSVLTQCVRGMTIARNTAMLFNIKLVWSAGHSQNLVEVDGVSPYLENDQAIDVHQKPVGLYKELVKALSTPGQCILDVCCGTGTGMVAGLSEGRNVISVDEDEEMERHIRLRLSKEVPSGPLHPEEDVDDGSIVEEVDNEILVEGEGEDMEETEEREEGGEDCEDSESNKGI